MVLCFEARARRRAAADTVDTLFALFSAGNIQIVGVPFYLSMEEDQGGWLRGLFFWVCFHRVLGSKMFDALAFGFIV